MGELKFTQYKEPAQGTPIVMKKGKMKVPADPIIPFIEGDGTGPDIWRTVQKVVDAAVEKAFGGKKKIVWYEVYGGEKAYNMFQNWLPDDTITAFRKYLIGIKGPLTTPVGGGIRSLNVTLRQVLDLYVCLRPVKYFKGVPSPVKQPELVDMVIFRENTEDIYAGIEFENGTEDNKKFRELFKEHFPKAFAKIRFPETSGIGIKPVSEEGTKRLVRAAIEYAISHDRSSVTLVHKGNIQKFTEGSFRNWGYELAKEEYGGELIDKGPWMKIKNPKNGKEIVIKDAIADNFLQQILTRPNEFEVIATLNLNGDYISDALAAEVGGIGIAPGGNINYMTGHAIFEATHGTAPKYSGMDKVNPGSVLLSSVMMLEHLGWTKPAKLIMKAFAKTIKQKTVTYDFARLMKNAKEIKCSEFGNAIIGNM